MICGADYALERGLICKETEVANRKPTCGTNLSGDLLAYCLTDAGGGDADNCGSANDRSCLGELFNLSECGNSKFDNARKASCIKNPEINNALCPAIILDYCDDDAFDATPANRELNAFHTLCLTDRTTDTIRQQACLANLEVSDKCGDTVTLACTGQQGSNTVTANLFNPLCYNSDTYQADREALVDTCEGEGIAPSDSSCANAKLFICAGTGEFSNPFVNLCTDLGNLADLQHIKCLTTDGDSDAPAACAGIIENGDVTRNVWQYKAVGADDDETPETTADDTYNTPLTILTEPTTDDPTANFLLGGVTQEVLDAAGFDTVNTADTLDLTTSGGDDLGGVFVFNANFVNGDSVRVDKLYAGLTPDVNLGATLAMPADGAPTTAVWVGRAIVQTFTSVNRDKAELYRTGVAGLTDVFELTINFTNSTIYSDTTVGINQKTANLVIDGGFSELGVIFGTTSLRRGPTHVGPLTGLIGAKGALGVFHSGTTPDERAFAGGFVASAKICTDDPFADGCAGDKASELERISFCETSPTDGKCTVICNANSFLPECAPIAFDTVRTTACLLNANADTAAIGQTPSRCIDLIDIHCKNVNPFDTNGGCNSNMAYNDQREVLCASDISNDSMVTARCTDTVIRACGVNPFNRDLCYVGDTHEGARVDLCNNPVGSSPDPTCISDNIVDVYCEKNRVSAGTNTRCDDWVVAECGANSFDPLCGDSGYDDERTTACLGGNIDNNPSGDRCPNLIDIHCTANPFDVRTNPVGGALWCENYSAQRTQLVADCLANPQTTTGCDAKLGTGKDTVANCVLDPFLTGCLDGMNDPLSVLSSAVIAYCTKDANVFQMNCDREEAKTPRANLIMRCIPTEEDTPVECGTIIVDGEISVSECIADPFLVECRITEFAEFAAGKCVTDTDNSLGRLFSSLCPDSDRLELRRNSYCRASNNLFKMNCDGRGSVDATRVDAVATCIAFGLDDPGCGKDRKLSDADNALTLGGCIENPYHADCRDAVFDPARPLVVTKCFDSRNNPIAVAECDTVVANGRTVAQCISDPFHLDCADAGFADAKIRHEIRSAKQR